MERGCIRSLRLHIISHYLHILLFYIFITHISSPTFNELRHILGQFGGEEHLLTRARMDKAKCAGMEGLTRADVEAIVDKLLIFGKMCTLQDLVSSVSLVVEEDVANVLHVHTYLVGTSRLEATLNQCDVSEALEHRVMGDGMFSNLGVTKDGHLHTVLGMAGNVAFNSSRVF